MARVEGATIFLGDEDACSFCGDKADAYWAENEIVLVCVRCAERVLPSLMADALCGPRKTAPDVFRALQRCLTRFWYSTALQVWKRKETTDDET